MSNGGEVCPDCGPGVTRKNGRDRQGRQIHQCQGCRRRFTVRSATPFAGCRFPPDVIALAVRWYLRYRLSYADVAELLAERSVLVDPSTVFDRVREFAPLCEEIVRPFRRAVGSSWSADETYATVAGMPVYVYRAIDGQGQVVDVYVSARRAADDAAAFFRRAIEATGVVPDMVTTDCVDGLGAGKEEEVDHSPPAVGHQCQPFAVARLAADRRAAGHALQRIRHPAPARVILHRHAAHLPPPRAPRTERREARRRAGA
jgi:transposase-like protein